MTSIEVVDSFTLDEWIAAVRILLPRGSCPWWIGDLMNFGPSNLGVSEDQFDLLSANAPFAEGGPMVTAAHGTLIPSEHAGGTDQVEPTSGELLI